MRRERPPKANMMDAGSGVTNSGEVSKPFPVSEYAPAFRAPVLVVEPLTPANKPVPDVKVKIWVMGPVAVLMFTCVSSS